MLDTLQERVGINTLMIGTISWLGLKVGRRISHALEGWPDHGVPAPYSMEGGSYIKVRPEYYAEHLHQGFRLARPRDGRARHPGAGDPEGEGARA